MPRSHLLFEAMRRPDGVVVIVVVASDGRYDLSPPMEIWVGDFYEMAQAVLADAAVLARKNLLTIKDEKHIL